MDNNIDTSSAGSRTVRLPLNASVRECAGLKLRLDSLLESVDVVNIDVTDVELIDTAGLQVLLAFSRSRSANGLNTVWLGESPLFRNAVTALGLAAGEFAGPGHDGVQP